MRSIGAAGIGVGLALLLTSPVCASVVLSFYIGASQTRPSDLHVEQPSRGNDATVRKVRWLGYPFRFEPYYGIRLSYTPPGAPQTSIALDFTHYKIYARTQDVVSQSGTWHGTALDESSAMSNRVQSIEMTHGLNMLGLSVFQQLSTSREGVYVGGGPVIYVPHTESRIDGLMHGNYGFGGWGFQTHAGLRTCIDDRPVFGELKYNEGHPNVAISQGSAQMTLQTIQELAGLDFGHCDPAQAPAASRQLAGNGGGQESMGWERR